MPRAALALFCLSVPVLAAPAFANGFAIGDRLVDPLTIAQQAVQSFAYGEEGLPGLSVDIQIDDQRHMVIVVAQTGHADDAVEGARFSYRLQPGADGFWTLIDTSVAYRCRRGGSGDWQVDLCP